MGGVWARRFGAVLVMAACGCRHSRCDLVEAEARAREAEANELRCALDGCKAQNMALQLEVNALRGGPGPVVSHFGPCPLKCIALGRQTGGHPSDQCRGDDALQVQVEPRDSEGHVVKVPGSSVLVQAVEISPEGLKRPLSAWEVPADELRFTWRTGLLSTGYVLTLPWKVWPTFDRLRVVAQLRLSDGRTFEADKDVTIRPAAAPGPVLPAPAPVAPPGVPSRPPGVPVLPTPLPVVPARPDGPALPLPPSTSDGPLPPSMWHAPPPEPAAELQRPVVRTP